MSIAAYLFRVYLKSKIVMKERKHCSLSFPEFIMKFKYVGVHMNSYK